MGTPDKLLGKIPNWSQLSLLSSDTQQSPFPSLSSYCHLASLLTWALYSPTNPHHSTPPPPLCLTTLPQALLLISYYSNLGRDSPAQLSVQPPGPPVLCLSCGGCCSGSWPLAQLLSHWFASLVKADPPPTLLLCPLSSNGGDAPLWLASHLPGHLVASVAPASWVGEWHFLACFEGTDLCAHSIDWSMFGVF